MAIQFACPGCQQPIEVDDEWALRQVACPYCRRTITAPAASTITGLSPPVAKPLGGPHALDGGRGVESGAGAVSGLGEGAGAESNPYAVWALVASILALVCLLGVNLLVFTQMAGTIDPNSSASEIEQSILEQQREWLEQAQKGQVPPALIGMGLGACGMLIAWLTGLVLTILALRRRTRRGLAIAALAITSLLGVYLCVGLISQF